VEKVFYKGGGVSMGKLISVIGGGVALVLGLILIVSWWDHFVTVLLGTIPVLLVFGGLIALFLGISEIKDEMAAKKEEKKKPEEKKE